MILYSSVDVNHAAPATQSALYTAATTEGPRIWDFKKKRVMQSSR